MATLNKDLLQDVMALPVDLRTKLIDILIESLNLPAQQHIDELWAEEADRRLADLDSDKVKFISGEKVFDEIRNRY